MIALQNINKKFGECVVLNDFSLKVSNGQSCGIVGSSGSGKTTLLQILATIESIDSGSYTFNNNDISNLSKKQRQELLLNDIGIIHQNYNLMPEFSVLENVAMPLLMIGDKNAFDKARIILEKLDMTKHMNKPTYQLSGGQKQRTGIARAIVKNPKLILADEPTGSLDKHNTEQVATLLFNATQNATLVIVTHDNYVSSFCDFSIQLA